MKHDLFVGSFALWMLALAAPLSVASAQSPPVVEETPPVVEQEQDVAPPPVAPPPPAEKKVEPELRPTHKAVREYYIKKAQVVETANPFVEPLYQDAAGALYTSTPSRQILKRDASGSFAPVPQGFNSQLKNATRRLIRVTPAELMAGRPDKKFAEILKNSEVRELPSPVGSGLPALKLPVIDCSFVWPEPGDVMSGNTPKFKCLPDPKYGIKKAIKVKYALNEDPASNRELGGEILATRLFWALGYGSDKVYPVKINCKGCPTPESVSLLDQTANRLKGSNPKVSFLHKPNLAARAASANNIVKLEFAAIELKFNGDEINLESEVNVDEVQANPVEGWSWNELREVNRQFSEGEIRAGLSQQALALRNQVLAENDGLRLLASFVQHGDNKPPQQRLVCRRLLQAGERSPVPTVLDKKGRPTAFCADTFMMVQDLGATFGSGGSFTTANGSKVNLNNWAGIPVWGEGALGVLRRLFTATDVQTPSNTGLPVYERVTRPYIYPENGQTFPYRNKIACETNLTRSQTAIDGEGKQVGLIKGLLTLTLFAKHNSTIDLDNFHFMMISEQGREFLGRRLDALTDEHILALIYASRAYLYEENQTFGGVLNDASIAANARKWLTAFRTKIRQISAVACASEQELQGSVERATGKKLQ